MSTFEMDFLEDARDFTYDKIDELDEGFGFYNGDLPGLLMEYDWANNTITFSAQKARDYIDEHPQAASETYDFLHNELGVDINVFDEPEQFHIAMFELGVGLILNQCPFIQDASFDEIYLDAESKAQLLSEIENVDLGSIN